MNDRLSFFLFWLFYKSMTTLLQFVRIRGVG